MLVFWDVTCCCCRTSVNFCLVYLKVAHSCVGVLIAMCAASLFCVLFGSLRAVLSFTLQLSFHTFSGSSCVFVDYVLQLGFTCVFWLTLRYFSYYCQVNRKSTQPADISLQAIENGQRASGQHPGHLSVYLSVCLSVV